jgi:hypothetical protein
MKYSDKTIAELCRFLGAAVSTHAEMDLLFLEHGLSVHNSSGGLQPRSNALVSAARQLDLPDAEKILTALIEYVLECDHPGWASPEKLIRVLRLDGFDWRDGALVPTTPEPAELAFELSALELDLHELGLNIASAHYRQAHESFLAGNWEAANGQIRSFIENVLIELGRRQTSKARVDPVAALQDLRHCSFFDNSEWQMLRGFWQSIQDNGPHHGLSNEQEALFRLHVATSIVRYAVHKTSASSQAL